jgi:hypothetical protein
MARSVVKAVGVAENANLRYRARMEDRYVVQNPLVGGPQESCYLAVYDGHGGREVRLYPDTRHRRGRQPSAFLYPSQLISAHEAMVRARVPRRAGSTIDALVWCLNPHPHPLAENIQPHFRRAFPVRRDGVVRETPCRPACHVTTWMLATIPPLMANNIRILM